MVIDLERLVGAPTRLHPLALTHHQLVNPRAQPQLFVPAAVEQEELLEGACKVIAPQRRVAAAIPLYLSRAVPQQVRGFENIRPLLFEKPEPLTIVFRPAVTLRA